MFSGRTPNNLPERSRARAPCAARSCAQWIGRAWGRPEWTLEPVRPYYTSESTIRRTSHRLPALPGPLPNSC